MEHGGSHKGQKTGNWPHKEPLVGSGTPSPSPEDRNKLTKRGSEGIPSSGKVVSMAKASAGKSFGIGGDL